MNEHFNKEKIEIGLHVYDEIDLTNTPTSWGDNAMMLDPKTGSIFKDRKTKLQGVGGGGLRSLARIFCSEPNQALLLKCLPENGHLTTPRGDCSPQPPPPPYAYEGHKSLKPIGVNEDEKKELLESFALY